MRDLFLSQSLDGKILIKSGNTLRYFSWASVSNACLKNQYSEEYWEEMNKHTVEEPVAEEEDRENDLT